eukprot:4937787-Pleurochrysis_carterae.AAC.1
MGRTGGKHGATYRPRPARGHGLCRTACARPGAERAQTRQRGDAAPPPECSQQHAAHTSRNCWCCALRWMHEAVRSTGQPPVATSDAP